MDSCDCRTVSMEQLKVLLESDRPEETEQAVAHLVRLLTSDDKDDRDRGYHLFRQGLEQALFRSCLNYGSLVRSFTHPLVNVLARTTESWASRTAR
jgi:hypothetical protein